MMRVVVKILATLSVLGMAIGLFTEADLTKETVYLYLAMITLTLAGIWM